MAEVSGSNYSKREDGVWWGGTITISGQFVDTVYAAKREEFMSSKHNEILLDLLEQSSISSVDLKDVRDIVADEEWQVRLLMYLLLQQVTESDLGPADLGIVEEE